MISVAKNYIRVPVSVILTFILLMSGLVVLDLAVAPKAHAGDCAGSSVMQCIGTSVSSYGGSGSGGGGILNPGTPSSAPVPVGPGGAVADSYFTCQEAPTAPSPRAPMYTGCAPEFRITIQEFAPGETAACAPTKMVQGFEVKLKKQLWIRTDALRWVLYQDNQGRYYYNPDYQYQTGENVCVYPEVNLSSQWFDCIVSWNVHADKIAGLQGLGNNLAVNSGTTGWGGAYNSGARGENLPATCETSKTVGLGYAPPQGQPGWGQYRAAGNMVKASCTRGGISFDGAVTYAWRCDGPRNVPAPTNYVTIACFGAVPGLVNADWTGRDCYNRPGFASCSVPNDSKLNGFGGNVQAIRDGNDNALVWANPSLVGNVGNDGNWRTRTVINGGSTPWDSSVGWNDSNRQLFRYDGIISSGGQWHGGGKRLNEKLAFYAAGDNGSPFRMTRDYMYDADFLTQQGSITSFDLTSGAIGTSTYAAWVRVNNNYCGPNSSPAISVVRAIGDSVKQ